MKITKTHYLNTVESTNTYLKTLDPDKKHDGLLVYTFNQTHGRGRRANKWDSRKDEDIALSIYHQSVQAQFSDLMHAAVSIVDTLKNMHIEATIKLPNDIYVNCQKIAGILIEKSLQANMASTVIGIGINVNSIRKENNNEISVYDVINKPIDKTTFITQFVESYNTLDLTSVQATFKSLINMENHECTYQGNTYNLVNIKASFMCVLEKNKDLIEVPCQNVTFSLKNR